MRLQRVYQLLTVAFLTALFSLPAAYAAEPASVVEGRLDSARAMIDSQGAPHFDGKNYKPGANFAAVYEVVEEIKRQIAAYGRWIKEQPPEVKNSEMGQRMKEKATFLVNWGNAALKAMMSTSKDRQQKMQFCSQFDGAIGAELMHAVNFREPDLLRARGLHVSPLRSLDKLVENTDKMVKACKNPEVKEGLQHCWMRKNMPPGATKPPGKHAFEKVCDMMPDRVSFLKDYIVALSSEELNDRYERMKKRMNPELLKQQEGWIGTDLIRTWSHSSLVNYTTEKEDSARVKSYFDTTGVPMPAGLFARFHKLASDYKAAIVTLGKTLKGKPTGRNFYGCKLAKSYLPGGSRTIKCGQSGNHPWKINKNSLGVIERRCKAGAILYQGKGEPLCQHRTFIICEEYAGGGKYSKDDAPNFSQVRWQQCK